MADNKSLASVGFSGRSSQGSTAQVSATSQGSNQTTNQSAHTSTATEYVSQDHNQGGNSQQQEPDPQQQQQPTQNEENESQQSGNETNQEENETKPEEIENFNEDLGIPKDSPFSFNHESALNFITAGTSDNGNTRQPVTKEEIEAQQQAATGTQEQQEDEDISMHKTAASEVLEAIEQLLNSGYSSQDAVKYVKMGIENRIQEERRIRELDKKYKKIAEEHEKKLTSRDNEFQAEKTRIKFQQNVDSVAKKFNWSGYEKTVDGKKVRVGAGEALVEFICDGNHGIGSYVLDMFDAFGKPDSKYGTKEYSKAANEWFTGAMSDPKLANIIAKVAHAHVAQKMLPKLMKRSQKEQQAIDKNNNFQVSAGGESRSGGNQTQKKQPDPKVSAYNRVLGGAFGKLQEI